MKGKHWGVALAVSAVSLGLILGVNGCSWQRGIKVGVVDTDRIIRESPKYMELKVMQAGEQQAWMQQIPSNLKSMSVSQRQEVRKKLAKDYKERSDKFSKKSQEFLNQLTEDIRGAAKSVAKDRHYDLIIVDSPSNPTVLYNSGDNITTDILLKFKS
ncbi:MAG: OmpH family outer membrane protein [bacterium]|nr:OmpH family outer membrane protein [bacterium]